MSRPCEHDTSCGISPGFPRLSPSRRQIGHVLLTRPPLGSARRPSSYDLHVLGTPPAFVLSQDQTLHRKLNSSSERDLCSRTLGPLRIKRSEFLSCLPMRDESRERKDLVPSARWARPLSRPRLSISVWVPRKIAGQTIYYSRALERFPAVLPSEILDRGPFGSGCSSRSSASPERNAAAASLPRLAARAIRVQAPPKSVNGTYIRRQRPIPGRADGSDTPVSTPKIHRSYS